MKNTKWFKSNIFSLYDGNFFEELRSYNGIFLEVGAGNGYFLEYLSRNFPEKLIVGIELDIKRAKKAKKRVDRSGYENVIVLSGNAKEILPLFFPNESVDRIYMNFPDPWPRLSSWRNRIFEVSSGLMYTRITKPGGQFFLATDVEYIYNDINETFCNVIGYWVLEDENIIYNFRDTFPGTHFYQKWLGEGRRFFWGVWRKVRF